jgi:hypothetical protein
LLPHWPAQGSFPGLKGPVPVLLRLTLLLYSGTPGKALPTAFSEDSTVPPHCQAEWVNTIPFGLFS